MGFGFKVRGSGFKVVVAASPHIYHKCGETATIIPNPEV